MWIMTVNKSVSYEAVWLCVFSTCVCILTRTLRARLCVCVGRGRGAALEFCPKIRLGWSKQVLYWPDLELGCWQLFVCGFCCCQLWALTGYNKLPCFALFWRGWCRLVFSIAIRLSASSSSAFARFGNVLFGLVYTCMSMHLNRCLATRRVRRMVGMENLRVVTRVFVTPGTLHKHYPKCSLKR